MTLYVTMDVPLVLIRSLHCVVFEHNGGVGVRHSTRRSECLVKSTVRQQYTPYPELINSEHLEFTKIATIDRTQTGICREIYTVLHPIRCTFAICCLQNKKTLYNASAFLRDG